MVRMKTPISILLMCCLALLGSSFAQKIESKVLLDLQNKGEATFLVRLAEQADTSPALAMSDWTARGEFVVNALKAVADRTQQPILDLLSTQDNVQTESFWIVNMIQVTTSNPDLVQELAARTDVATLIGEDMGMIPEPVYEPDLPRTSSLEWNITRVHADQVWDRFGVHGEGIVVANIDTGVMYDHPALMWTYRGLQDDGSFDHNYNWYDPRHECPNFAPCDTDRGANGHGTHTMGTMVGDDGLGNQIGVAPGAKWIAAKGCTGPSCDGTALIKSGQWMLAPTDRNGLNPRPDLRPHVINNSWGGSAPFYQDILQAWRSAGMVPIFASGNPGPQCGRAGYPGVYPEAISVGATTVADAIASFSGRGPAPDGSVKPDVSAPGAGIRSSLRDGGYGQLSGTSMAAPHVAGVVALLWSANPGLIGDVDTTAMVLESTTLPYLATQCGDAGPPNNVFGWGIIDALAAVQAVAPSDSGSAR